MKNLIIITDNRQNFNNLLMNLVDAGYNFEVENNYSTTERAIRIESEDVGLIEEIAMMNESTFHVL